MAHRSVPFPAIGVGPSAKNDYPYGFLILARSRIALFLASTALVALSSGCSHRPDGGPEGGYVYVYKETKPGWYSLSRIFLVQFLPDIE